MAEQFYKSRAGTYRTSYRPAYSLARKTGTTRKILIGLSGTGAPPGCLLIGMHGAGAWTDRPVALLD